MNTSIIISELSKDDFVRVGNAPLSLVDKLKLEILNIDLNGDEDFFINRINVWSNLPFLGRTIVILKDEQSSKQLYDHLQDNLRNKIGLSPDVKITLQPNLLSRSKSFDGMNDDSLVVEDLRKFRSNNSSIPKDIQNYQEPEPKKFDYKDLSKLGIDVKDIPQQKSVDDFHIRPRSSTKTIFKPSLNLNTDLSTLESMPSPTITLDETQ